MNVAVIMIFLAIVGAGLGSFACCQAWRLKKHDKSARSHCMSCNYQLKWYDNIPILSWLFLLGKCRKCHKKIGAAEILSELMMAALFVLSFAVWPWKSELLALNAFEIAKFAIFLAQLVVFMILAVYDAKWKEMPTLVLIISCAIGAVYWGVSLAQAVVYLDFEWEMIGGLMGAMIILPGFYYFMYKASKEAWVGSGDPILCVPLAMMLGDFWLAMFCLFGSNMIGSLIMLPVTAIKKEKHAMIPFGPFLVAGFLVVFFCRAFVLSFVSF